tara:strand:+ start:1586 stop:2503 length:918 start_codon:yes stop_codon:yes gene_type:complete
MNMKKTILLLITLTTNICFSQKAELDTSDILIGDQIQLNVSSIFEINEKYNWPLFNDSVFEKVEIISKGEIVETKNDSTILISQKLILTSFDSGSYYIPPFIFNEKKKTNGNLLNVYTISITDSNNKAYDITSTKIGTTEDFTEEELAEIRRKRWIIAGIIFATLFLGYIIYYLLRKYKKDGTILKPKIIIPAHVTALNKLQKLKKEKLWQKGELKEYYTRISTIIREYIELQFEFNALELPTRDIVSHLKNLPENEVKILEAILKKADNIKYAKGLSLDEENKLIIQQSVEFIKKTKIENASSK